MTQDRHWRVQGRRRVMENPWLALDLEDVELPSGHRLDGYCVVREPDWVIVLAVTAEGEALLVRQYKHGIGQVVVELPAGMLDTSEEAPLVAAARELREETGYRADHLELLAPMIAHPTRSPTRGHVVLATGCRHDGPLRLDVSEAIDVLRVPVTDLPRLVRDGSILVQSSIAAIYLALARLQERAAS